MCNDLLNVPRVNFFREDNGNQISIFFDMSESGISNLDMEFTKYLIGLFKSYYPNFLNYIIIFEMPWVLNAAFKIIKSWLPAKAIPKIKFVNKNTLKDYVDPNDVLRCWGGENDYTFKFVSAVHTNGDGVVNGKLDNKKVCTHDTVYLSLSDVYFRSSLVLHVQLS